MDLYLPFTKIHSTSRIEISGSKSETNRLLLLQKLYPNLQITNASNSEDSIVMEKAFLEDKKIVDIHHAGTAMRFLTAYFAIQENKEVVLTGSQRMQERPLFPLVDALKQLGAEIEYVNKEGFPPIKVKGKNISKNAVDIDASISSQYITALLLIAPKLTNGLEINLQGKITSLSYLKMTLSLLEEIGIDFTFQENHIKVFPAVSIPNKTITIESDWSSASYYYSLVSLSEIGTQITLSSFKKNSLQGDTSVVAIYKNFGVDTHFNEDHSITIIKNSNAITPHLECDLNSSPDIAQTIAVTCFGLGISCHLQGLHTLKIKETDRLFALKTELEKLGAEVVISEVSLQLSTSSFIKDSIRIKTYQDHRMAMAFAPLALKKNIIIEDTEVVGKSYPSFWDDLHTIGFKTTNSIL